MAYEIAGKCIWLEDGDQYKQLAQQKSYEKFLVLIYLLSYVSDNNLCLHRFIGYYNYNFSFFGISNKLH